MKGGYQLLDYREICNVGIYEITQSENQYYTITNEKSKGIIKNALLCGKPIILNNINLETVGNREIYNNLYLSVTLGLTYANAHCYTIMDGEQLIFNITHTFENDEVEIRIDVFN